MRDACQRGGCPGNAFLVAFRQLQGQRQVADVLLHRQGDFQCVVSCHIQFLCGGKQHSRLWGERAVVFRIHRGGIPRYGNTFGGIVCQQPVAARCQQAFEGVGFRRHLLALFPDAQRMAAGHGCVRRTSRPVGGYLHRAPVRMRGVVPVILCAAGQLQGGKCKDQQLAGEGQFYYWNCTFVRADSHFVHVNGIFYD